MGFTGRQKRSQEEKGAPMAPRVRGPRPGSEVTAKEDELCFLATMKRELADEIQKYEEFINVLAEFRNGRSMVVEHVTVLLAGHPDLLRGFDEFVPWGYKISQGGQGGQSGI
ncbi:hypothetical protein PVAP13_6KG195900 [Panicum virgatum]|uniref:Uncharacterized protein n=1 Tax=Panicum virgatum TaxID=38727 RepID=A0A8T0RCN1_PANVG|nr:hypothetical protein PVAP13_6KG195900 [Panicum virgatum]